MVIKKTTFSPIIFITITNIAIGNGDKNHGFSHLVMTNIAMENDYV